MDRLALLRAALLRFGLVRFAETLRELERLEPVRFAVLLRFGLVRFAALRLAVVRRAEERFAERRLDFLDRVVAMYLTPILHSNGDPTHRCGSPFQRKLLQEPRMNDGTARTAASPRKGIDRAQTPNEANHQIRSAVPSDVSRRGRTRAV